MTKYFKYILFPFSSIYGSVMLVRNFLFDKQLILKSKSYPKPVICVGNLTVGGTGKTPMIEYLIGILEANYKVAVLSRGYGRETKGFFKVDHSSTAHTVGDEPFQLYQKFGSKVSCFVCEKRVVGLNMIFQDNSIDMVLLDDAFQHRYVKPKINIMLTDYGRLFYEDFVLPMGRLREFRSGAERADLLVVTKCPQNMSYVRKIEIERKTNRYLRVNTPMFFSNIVYGEPISVTGKFSVDQKVILLTGIANSQLFVEHIQSFCRVETHLKYPDHHAFTDGEIKAIILKCKSYENVALLTTEKDWQRLMYIKHLFDDITLAYIPIKFDFGIENDRFSNYIKLMK